MISIEVCAVWADRTLREQIQVPAGSSITVVRDHKDLGEALRQCWQQSTAVSVFGEIRPLGYVLSDGDRIELLRPLLADPKEARRERAKLRATQAKSVPGVRKRVKKPSV